MAICTQQAQVAFVRGPVSKPSGPCVLRLFGPQFLRWINVVNVERSVIRKAARYALAAKLLDYFELSLPIARVLVYAIDRVYYRGNHDELNGDCLRTLDRHRIVYFPLLP